MHLPHVATCMLSTSLVATHARYCDATLGRICGRHSAQASGGCCLTLLWLCACGGPKSRPPDGPKIKHAYALRTVHARLLGASALCSWGWRSGVFKVCVCVCACLCVCAYMYVCKLSRVTCHRRAAKVVPHGLEPRAFGKLAVRPFHLLIVHNGLTRACTAH